MEYVDSNKKECLDEIFFINKNYIEKSLKLLFLWILKKKNYSF